MTGLTSSALHAFTTQSGTAPALAFAAGAVSGFGPCAAPRFVAASCLSARGRAVWPLFAAFALGTLAAYAGFAAVSSLVWRLVAWSPLIYACLSAVLIATGARSLLGRTQTCARGRAGSEGAAFLLGAVNAALVSPCCAPFVMAAAGYAAASGDPWRASIVLASFGTGHALPACAAAACSWRAARWLSHLEHDDALRVVGSTVSIALGAYYGVLA